MFEKKVKLVEVTGKQIKIHIYVHIKITKITVTTIVLIIIIILILSCFQLLQEIVCYMARKCLGAFRASMSTYTR